MPRADVTRRQPKTGTAPGAFDASPLTRPEVAYPASGRVHAGASAVLDGTHTSANYGTAAYGTTTFTAAQSIGVVFTTAGWTPTADNVTAILYVVYNGVN